MTLPHISTEISKNLRLQSWRDGRPDGLCRAEPVQAVPIGPYAYHQLVTVSGHSSSQLVFIYLALNECVRKTGEFCSARPGSSIWKRL